MKVKVEIEIPDDLCEPGGSREDHLKAIREHLGCEVHSVEGLFPSVWQVWSRIDEFEGEWGALDTYDGELPYLASELRDEDIYFGETSQDVCCDQKTATDLLLSLDREETVIRHAGMRHVDPMVMQVVTPELNLASVDISKFLMSQDRTKIESLASRNFKMDASDVGSAFSFIEKFVLNDILDGDCYTDDQDAFIYEISHEGWDDRKWMSMDAGSVCIDSDELEVWLREFRPDLQYPAVPSP